VLALVRVTVGTRRAVEPLHRSAVPILEDQNSHGSIQCWVRIMPEGRQLTNPLKLPGLQLGGRFLSSGVLLRLY
jgi:hypothetical protein